MMVDALTQAVELASAELLASPKRRYIGPSSLGKPCLRQSWYAFRWTGDRDVDGRVLRLFDRGHEEEHRIARWLTAAGAQLQQYSERLVLNTETRKTATLPWDAVIPENWVDLSNDGLAVRAADEAGMLKQWSFSILEGNYRGHTDGKVNLQQVNGMTDSVLAMCPGWGLLECKTHNTKSFVYLRGRGVTSAKPEHFMQMQAYMHELGLDWALYVAVNKNDDDLYFEVVRAKPHIGAALRDKAKQVIAGVPPQRIRSDPSWFECKWCPASDYCHHGKELPHNCRMCGMGEARPEGAWYCNHYKAEIPPNYVADGCPSWKPPLDHK
jgi:hypothetical protein